MNKNRLTKYNFDIEKVRNLFILKINEELWFNTYLKNYCLNFLIEEDTKQIFFRILEDEDFEDEYLNNIYKIKNIFFDNNKENKRSDSIILKKNILLFDYSLFFNFIKQYFFYSHNKLNKVFKIIKKENNNKIFILSKDKYYFLIETKQFFFINNFLLYHDENLKSWWIINFSNFNELTKEEKITILSKREKIKAFDNVDFLEVDYFHLKIKFEKKNLEYEMLFENLFNKKYSTFQTSNKIKFNFIESFYINKNKSYLEFLGKLLNVIQNFSQTKNLPLKNNFFYNYNFIELIEQKKINDNLFLKIVSIPFKNKKEIFIIYNSKKYSFFDFSMPIEKQLLKINLLYSQNDIVSFFSTKSLLFYSTKEKKLSLLEWKFNNHNLLNIFFIKSEIVDIDAYVSINKKLFFIKYDKFINEINITDSKINNIIGSEKKHTFLIIKEFILKFFFKPTVNLNNINVFFQNIILVLIISSFASNFNDIDESKFKSYEVIFEEFRQLFITKIKWLKYIRILNSIREIYYNKFKELKEKKNNKLIEKNLFNKIFDKEVNEINKNLYLKNYLFKNRLKQKVILELKEILNNLNLELYNFSKTRNKLEIIENNIFNFNKLNIKNNDNLEIGICDSLRINKKILLRTHATNFTARMLEYSNKYLNKNKLIDNVGFFHIGPVFRNDTEDKTHTHQFTQLDAFWITKNNCSLANLKWVLERICYKFFGSDIKVKFRSSYFPFTILSLEVDVYLPKLKAWVEILGAGLLHPKVLKNTNLNCNDKCKNNCKEHHNVSGWAFGLGIERLILLKYNNKINDIRNIFKINFKEFI